MIREMVEAHDKKIGPTVGLIDIDGSNWSALKSQILTGFCPKSTPRLFSHLLLLLTRALLFSVANRATTGAQQCLAGKQVLLPPWIRNISRWIHIYFSDCKCFDPIFFWDILRDTSSRVVDVNLFCLLEHSLAVAFLFYIVLLVDRSFEIASAQHPYDHASTHAEALKTLEVVTVGCEDHEILVRQPYLIWTIIFMMEQLW